MVPGFVARHALRLVGVAGAALDAADDRLDGDEWRVRLGDDRVLPFVPIEPLQHELVLRGVDSVATRTLLVILRKRSDRRICC